MEISVEEMLLLEDKFMVDIRSALSFSMGHIEGSVNYPYPDDIEGLCELLKDHKKDTVVIICTMGEKSLETAGLLSEKGFNTKSLKGGYGNWLLNAPGQGGLSESEKTYYSRQMILPEIGLEGQERLKSSKLLVIGAGALGTPVLTYLVRAGVGSITIADGDRIDLSNLHRQILYNISDVGRSKAEVAAERLREQNDSADIKVIDGFITPENISDIVKEYDFVIDATDRIETKFLINDACVIGNVPFCHAGVLAFEGQVMTWIPGKACYRCFFEEIPDGYVPSCSDMGIIGAAAGLIAAVQAMEAVKYITGCGELLTGRMLHADLKTMTFKVIPLRSPNPSCKVCGRDATIKDTLSRKEEYRLRCSLKDRT